MKKPLGVFPKEKNEKIISSFRKKEESNTIR
jgi:hypothetical protein